MQKVLINVLWLLLIFHYPTPVAAQPNYELEAFSIDYRNANQSLIDLSFLSEKPAGKQGFVSIKGGHFYKPNGTRLKLWGVNITDWTRGSVQIPERQASIFWANALSKLGVNCARLTFLDFVSPRGIIEANRNDTRKLDSVQLDKLDYWIYELKKNGIYIDLNLLVGRTFKKDDGVVDFDKIGWAKYASYFDPQLVQLQKEFANQLLTHYNPYTKTEYRNEPAIVIVELANENTLFDAWERDALHPTDVANRDPNFRNLTSYYSEMLTAKFNLFLQNTKSKEELNILKIQAGDSQLTSIPRIRKAAYESTPKELFQATVDFYRQVERDYFIEMNTYLKDTLQVSSFVLGSNDFLHNQPEYPMVWSNAVLDMEDGHVYWQHPSWPGKVNTPMVNEPDSSTIVKLSRTALAGKPYTVSEVNHAFPNDYECEGIPILAAYGSLQDWDAIMIYTFEPKKDSSYKGFVGDAFDISHHPVKIPQLAAGALMYLRDDIQAAKKVIKRNYSAEQLLESMRLLISESPYYTPGFSTSLVLQNQVRIGSMEAPENRTISLPKTNPLISDTKELKWYLENGKNGLVTIETSKSQGLIGFVKATGKSSVNLEVSVKNSFCAITLSSLDNKTIAYSDRLLLTAGARVENTGLVWNNERIKPVRNGGAPSLIEVVKGNVVIKGLQKAKSVTVTALDGSGSPINQHIKVIKSKKGWEFNVGEVATTWYAISIKR
ncbi:MAG TPA: hypothetical protein VLC98_16640 [Phnomibacter sp.]|nr:hypothetical protein [Phnomibacter sp.]